jgi:hypothetical protein
VHNISILQSRKKKNYKKFKLDEVAEIQQSAEIHLQND